MKHASSKLASPFAPPHLPSEANRNSLPLFHIPSWGLFYFRILSFNFSLETMIPPYTLMRIILLISLHLLPIAAYPLKFHAAAGENLVSNGSFEAGNTGFSSDLTYSMDFVTPGQYSITRDASTLNPVFVNLPGHTTGDDNYLIADPQGNEGERIWYTTVKVQANTSYEFSVWLSNVHTSFDNPSQIRFSVNRIALGELVTLPSTNSWTQYKWKWSSGTMEGEITLSLGSHGGDPTGNDVAMDDIEFYSTSKKPEVIRPSIGDTLRPKVHFPFDEATITEYSKQKLEMLLDILAKYPDMIITIVGNTDQDGEEGYNQQLSEKRSRAVYDYLVARNIDPQRLRTEAQGEKKLLYKGKSVKEQVRNRRVEFVINGYISAPAR